MVDLAVEAAADKAVVAGHCSSYCLYSVDTGKLELVVEHNE
jgi:hypothetical protein